MSINAQPFNPTFKLTGNLQQDQVLVYDVSENAFVNATGSGSGGVASSLDAVSNTGTGLQLADIVGTTLEVKSIIGGNNITITDNGDALVLDASFEESIQSGTNLGAGAGIYSGVDTSTNQLRFKSLRAVGGLTLADDGNTLTISLTGSAGGSDTDLSDYYTKTEVYNKVEADAKYLRLDAHSLPSQDNMFDIGSAERRFNDIYGETFQGTAVLAENLTISGNEGDVLTFVGGRWVAGQVTSDGAVATPELTISGNEITITGGNTVTLPVYADEDNYIKLDGHSLPTQDNMWDIGSAEHRFNDIYAETLQGTAVLAENLTVQGQAGQILTYNGSRWVAADNQGAGSGAEATPQTLSLNGTSLSISGANAIDLAGLVSSGSQGPQGVAGQDGADGAAGIAGQDGAQGLKGDTGDAGIQGPAGDQGVKGDTGDQGIQGIQGPAGDGSDLDLTNYYTKPETDALIPTVFSGDYADLTNTPTIPSLTGIATEAWVIDQGFLTTDNDNQGLVLTGSTLTITGSTTSIDLSTIIPDGFSGDYADLTNTPTIPTIPTNISDFTNDAGYITSAAVFSGSYNDLTDTPTVPVNLSDLSNVSTNAPADGQHLVFDSATGNWKPSSASEGSENGYSDADARSAFNGGAGLVYNASTGTYALNAQLSNLLDVDTTGISNGQVLKWNGAEFVPGDDTVLTSTDQLAEGSTNLWYSDTRVDNVLNGKTSSDIAEGVNLYFTSDRVNAILDTNIVAGTGINIVTGTDNVKTISATVSSLDFSNITNTPTTLAGYGITDNVQGPAGEDGAAGVKGDTGDQGVAGPKGDAGDAGIQGQQGIAGTQGSQGLKGDTGDAGADSTVAGPQGPQGLKGDKGDTGDQGTQGPAGADSTVAGPKGDTGDTGDQGTQGATGDTGPTGPTGPAGQDGADGTGTTDYNLLTNKPTIPSDVNDLTDTDGLLGGGGTSITSINELNDVNTAGITTGQFLSWDGTRFIATAQSGADLSLETLSELGDVVTDAPVTGDALVWNGSSWAPQAVSSGSGGSGTTSEYFKLNYATNGFLESITNTTSGVTASILSTTGGDVEVTFSGYTFPPAGILIYGYSRATNEYGIMPLNKDITTRKIAAGGTPGTPTAFGAMGSLTLTLKLREAETGSSRSFGTPTHAWVMFTMI